MKVNTTIHQAVKLASIVIHAEEATREGGHHFDIVAIRQLVADPDVQAWPGALDPALLPVRRSAHPAPEATDG